MSAGFAVRVFAPGGAEVIVPALNIDKRLFEGRELPARCKVERRIVAALIQHLDAAGFMVVAIDGYDGGRKAVVDRTGPNDAEALKQAAMELAFNLDDCDLVFQKKGDPEAECSVRIYFGNGIDCVHDWSWSTCVERQFKDAMAAFCKKIGGLA